LIGIYGAQKANPLLPYLIYQSGLLSLELGASRGRDGHSDTPPPSVQSPAIISLSGVIEETGAVGTMDEEVPPSRHITSAAQARILLTELGVVHPSAAARSKILVDREREAKTRPSE
jgi:hypothetical protein